MIVKDAADALIKSKNYITADTGREYPERPIIGVGGLMFENDSVLLVKRGKEPGKGMWSIPGGAVKVGETLAEGLAREMSEEVNLDVAIGPLVEVVERIFPDESGRTLYHYIILDFLCFPSPGLPKPGSDAAAAQYVPREQWPEYGLSGSVIRVIEKALGIKNVELSSGSPDETAR